jgi:hypothetical protein
MEKHRATLTDKERRKLVAIVTKGRNKASYIQRAHILLKSAAGKTDAEISQWLYISESTVRRTRLRFCEAGMDAALEDEVPTEHEPLLTEQQEGHLVALACSAPPEIYVRFSSDMQNDISLEAQERLCRQKIAERGGVVIDVYSDSAQSGWSLDRDGFQRLQADAARDRFDAIMVWKFDRW